MNSATLYWKANLFQKLFWIHDCAVRSQPGSHETRCHVYPEGLAHCRCCSRCALHLQVIHWSCDHSEAAQCFLRSAGQMFKSQLKTEADRTEASLHSDPQHLWYRKQRWVSIFFHCDNFTSFKSKFWENICTAARINPVQRYKVWFSKRMEWSIHPSMSVPASSLLWDRGFFLLEPIPAASGRGQDAPWTSRQLIRSNDKTMKSGVKRSLRC